MKTLSEAESYCWNHIQDNLNRIPNLSISILATESHVSVSTVNRTLKKMGYDGYSDFKQTIRNTKNERRKNGFSKEVNQAIRKNEIEITRTINQLSADDIVKTTKSDKKMVGDKIKFVLLRSVGDAYIDMSVTDDEMKQVLQG